jgi:hypothetical protein
MNVDFQPYAPAAFTPQEIFQAFISVGDTRWCSYLRRCATIRNAAGSIPDGVSEFFIDIISTMTLGMTQLLTLSCANCLEIWDPQLPGTPRGCPGL